LRHTKKNLFK